MERHVLWVRGVSFRKEQVAQASYHDPVVFEPEPTNKHDPNAIKVMVIRGSRLLHIGYVPKELTSYIRPLVRQMQAFYKKPNKQCGYWDAHVGQVIFHPDENDIGVQIVFESYSAIPPQEKLE